jgi:non-ribosomal peptide synthetase component F
MTPICCRFADACYFADAVVSLAARGHGKPIDREQVRRRWVDFAGQGCTIQAAQPYIVDDAAHPAERRSRITARVRPTRARWQQAGTAAFRR